MDIEPMTISDVNNVYNARDRHVRLAYALITRYTEMRRALKGTGRKRSEIEAQAYFDGMTHALEMLGYANTKSGVFMDVQNAWTAHLENGTDTANGNFLAAVNGLAATLARNARFDAWSE